MSSVQILIDYQNAHLSVRDAFAPPGTPARTTLIHPVRFAEAVMQRRVTVGRGGNLDEIHVYRGQPSSVHEPRPAARNKAQAAEWTRDRRVTMHARPLRHPLNWPTDEAREKGVDVMLACDLIECALDQRADTLIVASRDTDLLPALEMATKRGAKVEVVTWQGLSRLRLPNPQLWCTYLDGADYLASKDPKQY